MYIYIHGEVLSWLALSVRFVDMSLLLHNRVYFQTLTVMLFVM